MKKHLPLILIIALSTFLRLYHLSSLPNSYTPDELAQGYTAYSLLETGKDEWGQSWPLNLRSFGDFKPPLQTYLIIPFVKFLGLNPLAVRLPNAILSSLAPLALYLFTGELFKDKKTALFSSLFLSLSPWHLPMSRLALEANLAIFLLPLASYLLLSAGQSRLKMILSSLLFGLSLLSYHSTKLFTPFYLFFLLFYLLKTKKIKFKKLVLPIIAFLPFALFALSTFFGSAAKRGVDTAVFSPTDHWATVSDSRWQAIQGGLPEFPARFFNNKIFHTSGQIVKNYFSYFSPQFLLTQGAGETTYGMLPGSGVLNPLSFFLLLFLFYKLCSLSLPQKSKPALTLLLASLFLAPFPAALAKGNLAANRAALMLVFLLPLLAFSASIFFKKQTRLLPLFLLVFSLFSLSFLVRYFFQANSLLDEGMLYGRREAITWALEQKPSQIIMSRTLSEPQAYLMFFAKVDPLQAQKASPAWLKYEKEGKSFVDQLGQYNLGNRYLFKNLNFPEDQSQSQAVLIGRPQDFPGIKPDKIIYYPHFSQKEAIYLLKNSPKPSPSLL